MQRLSIALFSLLLLGCARTPEENLARYLREGKQFVAKKDYPRAILQFNNAAKSMPKDAEPYYQLGLTAIAMGDTRSAPGFLNQAIVLDPRHVDAMIALADLFTLSAHPSSIEEGKRLAQRALAIVPENVKALNLIALSDLRMGHATAAAAQLEDLLRRFPNHTETSINLARVFLTRNDRHGAGELLRNAATTSPQDATALFALADFTISCAIRRKRQTGTRAAYGSNQKTLRRWQLWAGYTRIQVMIRMRIPHSRGFRRFPIAVSVTLMRAGFLSPVERMQQLWNSPASSKKTRKTGRPETHLIDAYLDSGRISEAERLLTKAIATDSRDVDALTQRARVHLLHGKVDDAEKDLNIVQQYRPESAQMHYLTAQVHRYRQREQVSLTELSETLRLDPHYKAARIELTQLLIPKDPQRALNIIDSAPEDQRQNLDLRIQRIWPLIELKRAEEARAAIDALLGSGGAEALLQDAVLRMRQKDFTAARVSAKSSSRESGRRSCN